MANTVLLTNTLLATTSRCTYVFVLDLLMMPNDAVEYSVLVLIIIGFMWMN